jgi:hypothetical protein
MTAQKGMKAAALAMTLMVGLFAFGKEWAAAIVFSLFACRCAYYAGRLEESSVRNAR